jgi:hypothetical protein
MKENKIKIKIKIIPCIVLGYKNPPKKTIRKSKIETIILPTPTPPSPPKPKKTKDFFKATWHILTCLTKENACQELPQVFWETPVIIYYLLLLLLLFTGGKICYPLIIIIIIISS